MTKIHPTAEIHPTAKIGLDVNIGAFTSIGPHSVIEDGVSIAEHCLIQEDVQIGKNTKIFAFTQIASKSKIANNVIIHNHCHIGSEGYGYAQNAKFEHFHIPQIGNVVIEENVVIHSHASIDRAAMTETKIAAFSQLGCMNHIAHNVQIDENAKTGIGFVVAGSSHIEKNFVAEDRVSVSGHLKICPQVHLKNLSVMNNTHNESGVFSGFPPIDVEQDKINKENTKSIADMYDQLQKWNQK